MSQSPFSALGLCAPLARAVAQEGYTEPTSIQAQAIPPLLRGSDLLGCAQTGTGKTAAFILPLLQRLGRPGHGPIRALVLTPTRELAAQIAERASAYGRHLGVRHCVIYGGVSQFRQERELQRRPDLVIATPGRLKDLIGQGLIDLSAVELFVLDEADRMLDMGFINDVRRIATLVKRERQTLLFSATMPGAVEELAHSLLKNPVCIAVAPELTTAERVEQSVYLVDKADKKNLLESVLAAEALSRVLVFTRTKRGAERVAKQLGRAGVSADAIHGNKSQNAREKALNRFRVGGIRVLVATDVAARGIDVSGISHVINYDLPNVPEAYVHRIGRTGRAGSPGVAISFCDREEKPLLRDIERFIRRRLSVESEFVAPAAVLSTAPPAGPNVNSRPLHESGRDAGPRDASRPGSAPRDGQRRDAAPRDSSRHEAGPRDASRRDAAPRDDNSRREAPSRDVAQDAPRRRRRFKGAAGGRGARVA